jgi:hypothetical protein
MPATATPHFAPDERHADGAQGSPYQLRQHNSHGSGLRCLLQRVALRARSDHARVVSLWRRCHGPLRLTVQTHDRFRSRRAR